MKATFPAARWAALTACAVLASLTLPSQLSGASPVGKEGGAVTFPLDDGRRIDLSGNIVAVPNGQEGRPDCTIKLPSLNLATKKDADGNYIYVRDDGAPFLEGTRVAVWGLESLTFAEGLLALQTSGGKTGFVDAQAKWKIQPLFAAANSFSDGLAAVVDRSEGPDRHVGFIDKTGKIVIAFRFDAFSTSTIAPAFFDGLALMPKIGTTQYQMDHDTAKWGFIGKTGKWVIPPVYDGGTEPFNCGLAVAYRNGRQLYIDRTGKIVWPKSGKARKRK